MTGEVRADERGRVTSQKEGRDRYGERYRLVELHSGIELVPLPDGERPGDSWSIRLTCDGVQFRYTEITFPLPSPE